MSSPASAFSASSIPMSSAQATASAMELTAYAKATVDVPTFVFHIDLLLLAIAGVFILSTFPRLFAALRRPSYFFTGYFMRGPGDAELPGTARDDEPRDSETFPASSTTLSARTVRWNEDSQTMDSHAHTFNLSSSTALNGNVTRVPTRFSSWITLTHPTVISIISREVLPGVTFQRGVVILTIFIVLAYTGFYKSNPFSNPVREGFIAMALFPLVVALACKNNILTWLAGVGYEKLNWLHRAMGTLLVLCANLHGVGFIYKWANDGIFYTMINIPRFQYALVALGAMDLLYLGSRQFVRQKSYTFFLLSHFVGFIAATVGMANHWPVTFPYVVAGASVYAIDRVLRLARTRPTVVYITPMAHLNNGTTHVHMPYLTRGYRAGQHVRVRVVDGTGILAWIRVLAFSRPRPFTLASRPSGSGAELYVKKERGTFTTGLYEMAKGASYKEKSSAAIEAGAGQVTRTVRMLVEGPYGGPSYTMFDSYSGVVLVAGGSGISFALGVLDDLMEAHATGRSRVRAIEIVWAIADPVALTALLPVLCPLLRPRPSPHSALAVRMIVHYTRSGGRGPLPDSSCLPTGVHLRAGRPDLSQTLDAAIDSVLNASPASERAGGLVAAACGPLELVAQLQSAVGSLSWKRWRDVGGVETVSEAFAF
ncbi:hypothetical protein PENSPDRAFT_679856 [Peniophora sp. CONT]|nr:hypothetical protein PENSPDRAFT_679856 [Peniophora sp. CONT]